MYEGFTNVETFTISHYIHNDQGEQRYWIATTKYNLKYKPTCAKENLAKSLENYFYLFSNIKLWKDSFTIMALDQVDWDELADELITKVKEGV